MQANIDSSEDRYMSICMDSRNISIQVGMPNIKKRNLYDVLPQLRTLPQAKICELLQALKQNSGAPEIEIQKQ
jgi:hypothetical protein